MKHWRLSCWTTLLLMLAVMAYLPVPAGAYDINDKFSISAVMAGVYQYETTNDTEEDDRGRGAFVFQPEASFSPTENDAFFVKFGFAGGNGLAAVTTFNLAPWAAGVEDDVKDINGRNRDYLLTAWYKHSFQLGDTATLGLTGGIIDATDYVDENAFANDEYTQFMNEALVNGPNGFAPSFDLGAAAEVELGGFSLKAVLMNVGENDDGNNYHFYGTQLGYRLDTPLGEGNYRVMVHSTSKQFLDKDGRDKERHTCVLLSFDQQLGKIFGAWMRLGWEDDKAAVDYQNLFSGGVDISGTLWGRQQDNIGIGLAYLDGGNLELESTTVAEAYLRMGLIENFALTLDVQYMKDKHDNADDPNGFIGGVRLTAEF